MDMAGGSSRNASERLCAAKASCSTLAQASEYHELLLMDSPQPSVHARSFHCTDIEVPRFRIGTFSDSLDMGKPS